MREAPILKFLKIVKSETDKPLARFKTRSGHQEDYTQALLEIRIRNSRGLGHDVTEEERALEALLKALSPNGTEEACPSAQAATTPPKPRTLIVEGELMQAELAEMIGQRLRKRGLDSQKREQLQKLYKQLTGREHAAKRRTKSK